MVVSYHAFACRALAQRPTCAAIPDGLVSWWRAESNSLDSVGSNHANLQNGTGFSPGKVSGGFTLDGVDDYILVNSSLSLDAGAGAGFTIEGWINPASVAYQMPIAEYEKTLGTFSGDDVGVHFYISVPPGGGSRTGSFYANVKDTTGADHPMASAPGLVVSGIWQHVALAYEKASGLATIYLNGAVAAQTNLGSFTPQTSFNLVLGARTTFGSTAQPADRFWGMLDEMSLYKRALDATEIRAIHNADRAGKCLAVPTPAQAIESLRAAVLAAALKPDPLVGSLSAALQSTGRQNWNAARNELKAFANKVRAQVTPSDPSLAEQFLRQVQAILDSPALNSDAGPTHGKIKSFTRAAHNMHLEFSAQQGGTYIIESSNDLTNWDKVGAATEVASGDFAFDEPISAQTPARFYRVVLP